MLCWEIAFSCYSAIYVFTSAQQYLPTERSQAPSASGEIQSYNGTPSCVLQVPYLGVKVPPGLNQGGGIYAPGWPWH